MASVILLNNVTATGASPATNTGDATVMAFQAVGQTTSGSGAATIEIDVSNDGVNWLALGIITLSLSTTPSTDGFSSTAPWAFTRADVKSISGSGASVSVLLGV